MFVLNMLPDSGEAGLLGDVGAAAIYVRIDHPRRGPQGITTWPTEQAPAEA